MNCGSSELSASCLLSWSSLLASLAMCVVPSTILAGCRVAMASSQLSVACRIAAIDRLTNLQTHRFELPYRRYRYLLNNSNLDSIQSFYGNWRQKIIQSHKQLTIGPRRLVFC